MTNSNPTPEQPKKNQIVNNLALYSVGGQVGCATIIIIFVALLAGIGLDSLLGTKPAFTLLFILGSAPLSLFVAYRLAIRTVKNVTPNEPVKGQSGSSKEDEESD